MLLLSIRRKSAFRSVADTMLYQVQIAVLSCHIIYSTMYGPLLVQHLFISTTSLCSQIGLGAAFMLCTFLDRCKYSNIKIVCAATLKSKKK